MSTRWKSFLSIHTFLASYKDEYAGRVHKPVFQIERVLMIIFNVQVSQKHSPSKHGMTRAMACFISISHLKRDYTITTANERSIIGMYLVKGSIRLRLLVQNRCNGCDNLRAI